MNKELSVEAGNKLIAKFTGAKHNVAGWGQITIQGKGSMAVSELKYHSSWDWQIPAWNKASLWFNSLLLKADRATREAIKTFRDQYANGVHNNNIDFCCKTLLSTIEWHNEIKHQNND